jgi:hypothetical protein
MKMRLGKVVHCNGEQLPAWPVRSTSPIIVTSPSCHAGCNSSEHGASCRSVSPGGGETNFILFLNPIISTLTKICTHTVLLSFVNCCVICNLIRYLFWVNRRWTGTCVALLAQDWLLVPGMFWEHALSRPLSADTALLTHSVIRG